MSVELLIAKPATGKTQACIQRIQAALREQPLKEVRVVVPDRLQAAAFRQRLAQAGGAIGAYVGTFGDLYRSILEKAERNIPLASSPLQHYILQEIVSGLTGSGDLNHYASLHNMPGFYMALRDVFAELKRSLVYPDQFAAFAKTGTPAQQELARLYLEYQSRMIELGWADTEGLSWLAVETLENNLKVAEPLRLLIVDGFDFFTGAQLRTLQLLSQTVEYILVTLPGTPDSQRPAHRRFSEITKALQQVLDPQVTTLDIPPVLPTDIQFIESFLFESAMQEPISPVRPFLLETRSPVDEAREALRWMKKMIVRDGLSPSDCAIFAPNPDVYNPFLRAAAAEFGIPVHFTQGIPLVEVPAIGALLNLLTLPIQNYRARILFNALRSPYFEIGMTPDLVDNLKEICRTVRITEGQTLWNETWDKLIPLDAQTQVDIDDERVLPNLPHGEPAQALRQSLDSFFEMMRFPEQAQSQTEWVGWLEELLERIRFFANTDGVRDAEACDALRETLRALVLSETILGSKPTGYAGFVAGLANTLGSIGLPEPRLRGQAALLIGRMVEARGLRYKAVALLGFSEGVFPEVERPDPFLDETMRQALGMESRLNREQAGLLYQVLTRADQSLLIVRPSLAENGEEWEASPFWKEIQKRFDQSAVQARRPEELEFLNDAGSSQELLFYATSTQKLPEAFSELRSRWEAIQHGGSILQARRAKQANSKHAGNTPELFPELSQRYASDKVWSASRLEAYGNCPHQFFVKSALGLEPRTLPEPGIEISQLGEMLHKILEETYKQAPDPSKLESVLEILPTVAWQEFATAPAKYGFSPSSIWAFEQAQLLTTLQATIEALDNASKGWTPAEFEKKFGIDGNPPLEINLGEETIRFRGIIDRLDKNERGELRVMDYKTGGSHLTQKDLQRGTRLQLPIYALAAQEALGLGTVTEGMYWKIKDAEAGSLKLSKFSANGAEGVDAAVQVVTEHLRRIITGIRAGQFPPVPPKGGCPSYCPAASWCWRYEPGFGGAQ